MLLLAMMRIDGRSAQVDICCICFKQCWLLESTSFEFHGDAGRIILLLHVRGDGGQRPL